MIYLSEIEPQQLVRVYIEFKQDEPVEVSIASENAVTFLDEFHTHCKQYIAYNLDIKVDADFKLKTFLGKEEIELSQVLSIVVNSVEGHEYRFARYGTGLLKMPDFG